MEQLSSMTKVQMIEMQCDCGVDGEKVLDFMSDFQFTVISEIQRSK